MNKKLITPRVQEILIKNPDENTHYLEVFHYKPEEEDLASFPHAHLLVVSQLLTDDENLSYIPNLIASYIKRELRNQKGEELAHAYETALKKTNELIHELFETHNVKLDITSTIIHGEHIYASRIGKAKLFLARENECIEVFNNVDLFEKHHFSDKEFSNILSGKVQADDKLMLFIPNRRLSAREHLLKASLAKMEQSEFNDYLTDLGKNLNTSSNGSAFTCAALHIQVSEEVTPIAQEESLPADTREGAVRPHMEPKPVLAQHTPSDEPIRPLSALNSEVAKISKRGIATRAVKAFWNWNLQLNKKIDMRSKIIGLLVITALLIGGVFATRVILSRKKAESRITAALEEISNDFKTAKAKLLTGDIKEARSQLYGAVTRLHELDSADNSSVITLRNEVRDSIQRVDKVRDAQPALLYELNEQITDARKLFVKDEAIFLTTATALFAVRNGELEKIGELPINDRSLGALYENGIAFYHDKSFVAYSFESQSVQTIRVETEYNAENIALYADNLYFSDGTHLIKVPDIFSGGEGAQEWLTRPLTNPISSFVVDKNIFAVTENDAFLRLYTGDIIDERTLEFPLSGMVELFQLNNDFLIVDKENRRARLIDNGGVLKATYDLSNTNSIKDVYFKTDTQTLYLLADEKIWNLNIEI